MKFTIPGIPIPKARHRTVRNGKFNMEYDPQAAEKKSVAWKLTIQVREAFNDPNKRTSMNASNLAFAEAVSVEMVFFMPFPASAVNKRLNRFLWGLEKHNSKPDLDNLQKFILDAANGILFADDKQIIDIHAQKRYSLNPRTEIIVMPKNNMDIHQTADAILQTLSPTEFHDLVEITHELSSFACTISQNTDLRSLEEDPQLYRSRLTEAASLISELAERFGPYLSLIKKKYPNFFEMTPNLKPLYNEDHDEIS